jgi:hypothetical protein
MNEKLQIPSVEQVEMKFTLMSDLSEKLEKARSIAFPCDVLNQPDMFHIFLDHMTDLGLIKHNVHPSHTEYREWNLPLIGAVGFQFIRLSSFGMLFYRACVSTSDESDEDGPRQPPGP